MSSRTINADVADTMDVNGGPFGPFWVDDLTGYVVYDDDPVAAQLVISKTTDRGQSWSEVATISHAGANVAPMAAWFDRNTPGNTGSIIYIAYLTPISTDHRIQMRRFDTSTDTLSTNKNVCPISTGTYTNYFISITKSVGGNIYVQSNGVSGSASSLWRSTDDGENFTARATFSEGVEEKIQLLPANLADTNDIWCIYFDQSADELDIKTYDDSANSVSITNISTGIVENTTNFLAVFAATVRHSDGHALVAVFTEFDTATADLKTYDIADAGSITQKTNILTNIDDVGWPTIFVNNRRDHVYVGWIGAPDGSGTLTSSVDVWFVYSKDGMTNWSRPAEYYTTNDDYRALHSGFGVGIDGGHFMPVVFDDDDSDLFVEDTRGVWIAPETGDYRVVEGPFSVGVVQKQNMFGPFWTSELVGYKITSSLLTAEVLCYKTVDGGDNWIEVDWTNRPPAGAFPASNTGLSVVWDKQVPGNTGGLIHTAFMVGITNSTNIYYTVFDTATDTWGSPVTVVSEAATSIARRLEMTMAASGRLYIDNGSSGLSPNVDHMFYSDDGTTWNVAASRFYEAVSGDVYRMFPANLADPDDIWCVFQDISANAITLKTYDASADTVSETAIVSSIVESTSFELGNFGGSVRRSDGHLFVAVWNAIDTSTADLFFYEINGAGSITLKSTIFTDVDNCVGVDVFIDEQSGDIYVVYGGSNAGDETPGTAISVNYVVSTDGGSTWGSEQSYLPRTDNYSVIIAGGNVGDEGGRFQPTAYSGPWNAGVSDIVRDVAIPAAAGSVDVEQDIDTEGVISTTGIEDVASQGVVSATAIKDAASQGVVSKVETEDAPTEAVIEIEVEEDVDTEAVISRTADEDVDSEAAISRTEAEDVVSQGVVSQVVEEEIDTQAAISQLVEADIESEAALSRTEDVDVASEGVVSKTEAEDVASQAVTTRIEDVDVASEASIEVFNLIDEDVETEAAVSRVEDVDLATEAHISQAVEQEIETGAAISKTETEDVASQAVLRTQYDEDVASQGVVSHVESEDIESEASISQLHEAEFASQAVVSQTADKDVASQAAVQKVEVEDVASQAVVQKLESEDVASQAVVSQQVEQEFATEAAISQLHEQEIETEAAVSQTGSEDVDTSGVMTAPVSASVLNAAVISKVESEDVATQAHVSQVAEEEIAAEAAISRTAQEDISSQAAVSRLENKDVTSEAVVNKTESKDLATQAHVSQTADVEIQTQAHISQLAEEEVSSEAAISQTVEADVSSQAVVQKQETEDVLSSAAVSVLSDLDLESVGVVATTIQVDLASGAVLVRTGTASVVAEAVVTLTAFEEVATGAVIGNPTQFDMATAAVISLAIVGTVILTPAGSYEPIVRQLAGSYEPVVRSLSGSYEPIVRMGYGSKD